MDWKDAKFYVDNQLDSPYGNDKKQLCKRLTVSSNATIYQMMVVQKWSLCQFLLTLDMISVYSLKHPIIS